MIESSPAPLSARLEAGREPTEILIAINPQTAVEDLAYLPAGGVCFYPNDLKFRERRDLCRAVCPAGELCLLPQMGGAAH